MALPPLPRLDQIPTVGNAFFQGSSVNSPPPLPAPSAKVSSAMAKRYNQGECPSGQRWDETSQSCIDDGSGGPDGGGTKAPGGGEQAPKKNKQECPAGHEWDAEHNGCKVAGTNWDDGCWMDTDGKVYCKGNPKPSGGGGGGGAPGAGGGGTPAVSPFNPTTPKYEFKPWKPPAQTPFEKSLEEQLNEFLGNWDKSVPYTPEVIRNMKTDAFKTSFGRTNANREAIESDAARRGVMNSTGTDRRLDLQRANAEGNFAGAERDITNTSTVANFQAQMTNRLAALDRAQAHVNAEREFLMASEMNDFARQEKLAQIALAYYNLEQQRWGLTQQLNLSKTQFNQNLDWQKILLQWQIANGLTA